MSNNEFSRAFQYEKIPLDFSPKEKERRATNTKATLKRILMYLAAYRWKLTLVIFMVLLSSSLALLGPYLIGIAIDTYIVAKEVEGLLRLIGALLLIYLFYSLAIFLQNFWMIDIAQQTVYTLRHQLFDQFHRLPISYFDSKQQGELMSRVTNDIDN